MIVMFIKLEILLHVQRKVAIVKLNTLKYNDSVDFGDNKYFAELVYTK